MTFEAAAHGDGCSDWLGAPRCSRSVVRRNVFPGNASGGAGFWLAVALFLTPGLLALAYYFYTGSVIRHAIEPLRGAARQADSERRGRDGVPPAISN